MQAYYVLPRYGLRSRGIVRTKHETVVDPVDVSLTLRVLEHHLPSHPQPVQIPEHQKALRARVAQPVARYVDVRLPLPWKTRSSEVQRTVAQSRLVVRISGVDGHPMHVLHARDGQFHCHIPLRRRGGLFSGPPDVDEHEP